MDKKKLVITSVIAVILCIGGVVLFNNKDKSDTDGNSQEVHHLIKLKKSGDLSPKKAEKSNDKDNTVIQKTSNTKKQNSSDEHQNILNKQQNANLYSDIPSSALPLSSITLISKLPENIKPEVNNIYESSNVYMTNKTGDKLLIITENSANMRHEIEFTEISLSNGHKTNTTFGYNDKFKDFDNEIWEYDKDTNKPLRHTVYDKSGDMIFVENWNYAPENAIKYEMKDSDDKVISIKKETLENGTDLRVEHILYDKDGHTKLTVTASYDGADIKRFTYYNADKPNESGSVFSEYTEGVKTKEKIYTSDLKLKNTYTSDYKDGDRQSITVYTPNNEESEVLLSE